MNNHPSLCFLELTDFSYRIAVCSDRQSSIKIEAIHEFPLSETNRLAQLLPPGSELICALRAKTRQAHLASSTEANEFKGLAGLQQFAQRPDLAAAEPAWFAGVQASDGQTPAGKPWLLSLSPEGAHQQARALFDNLKPKSTRYVDATIITIGSLGSLVTTPTLLLEVGELASQAFLVSKQGVHATQSVTLNLDQIAEAIQAEFNLKFRGSAAKLFFNPDCDFTDHATQIASRLALSLKKDLTAILASQPVPTALCCSGLPAAQHWLALSLAKELGLTPFALAAKSVAAANGVTFATPAMEAGLTSDWFNFFSLIKAQVSATNGLSPWLAEWHAVKTPLLVTTTVPPGKLPQAETAFISGTAVATKNVPVAPVAVTAAPIKSGPNFATAPRPQAKEASPATPSVPPVVPPVTPTAPAAQSKVVAPRAAGQGQPPKSAGAALASPLASAAPQKKASSAPVAAKSAPPAKPTTTFSVNRIEEVPGKSRSPFLIGIAVVAIVIIAGFFYWQSQNAKAETDRLAQEKKATELRLQAEAEKSRIAEEKIKQEAAAHQQFQFETNQKLAAAEAARQQAENEARQQITARLANARGNLRIVTEPAGAMVTIGDQPPVAAPVTQPYLKIGHYPVTIRLPRYDEVKLDLVVTENGTTNPGLITLTRIAGALAITSDPVGFQYEVHPVNTPTFSVAPKLTGKTPATLADLEPGDYLVTYSRVGWAPHSETITVLRDGTARSNWIAPKGQIQITSEPAGATVTQNGINLGRTPLTLTQPPGAVRYDLTMLGYDPVVLSGQSEGGTTLALTTRMLSVDRIYGSNEADVRPEPIKSPLPDIPERLHKAARTEVQLVVGRDGIPKDIKVVKTTNPDLVEYYLKTAAKWRFKPAMKAGKPVNALVLIPFTITDAPPSEF